MSLVCLFLSCLSSKTIEPERFHSARLQSTLCSTINKERKARTISPLHSRASLAKAAQEYAVHLAKSDYFDHIHLSNPQKRTPLKRALAHGAPYISTAENLAKISALRTVYKQKNFFIISTDPPTFSTSEGGPPLKLHTYQSASKQLTQGWLNSPSHRKNLLSKQWTHTGCGASIHIQKNGIPMLIGIQLFQ